MLDSQPCRTKINTNADQCLSHKSPASLNPLGSSLERTVSLQRTVSARVLCEGMTPKSVFSTAELMADSEHSSDTPDSNGDDEQSSGTGTGEPASV